MQPLTKSTSYLFSVSAGLILATSLLSYDNPIEPGQSGMPLDATRQSPSCGMCHPSSGGERPQVSTVADRYVLAKNAVTTVTTSAVGGPSNASKDPDAGGFLAEATAGTFAAGANSVPGGDGTTISQNQSTDTNNRTWVYGYEAPSTAGLVEITSVAMSANDQSGTNGDEWAFNGFDNTATVSTPTRLYVLADGVEYVGAGCPDGYGNQSVLGADQVPAVGNAAFGLDIAGASPGNPIALYGSFNQPGFTSIPLAPIGLGGCSAYVQFPVGLGTAVASAGIAERGDGAAFLPVPIPNKPALAGAKLVVQAAYLDPSATPAIGRFVTVSVTNGLRLIFQ